MSAVYSSIRTGNHNAVLCKDTNSGACIVNRGHRVFDLEQTPY
jgi:hypothetical protein